MPSEPKSSFPLTLDMLHDLLGTDRDLGPRHLLTAARNVRGVLSPLVLSLAAREDVPMGTGALDELRRMTRRAATYRDLADHIARVPGARVVKGPSLARHYPEGVLRPVGDLDVVVPDEAALWQALHQVSARQACDGALYTELRQRGVDHQFVGLWWPAEDPLLDHEYTVEVSTFAFAGEHGRVPLRPELPADQVHADILALAEERFQRPFTVKDTLDLALVLTSPAAPSPRPLAAVAQEFHLAPELLQLCESTAEQPAFSAVVPVELLEALREPAEAERRRRAALPPVAAEEPDRVDARVAAELPIYGMQLTETLRQGAGEHVVRHRYDDGLIVRTPIADFLMVPGELVDPRRYEAALTELAGLDPWPAPSHTAGRS